MINLHAPDALTCTIETLSEDALLLRFGDSIDAATNARVHAAARALREAALPGVIDIAPAYASLLVRFDPSMYIGCSNTRPLSDIATTLRSVDSHLPLPRATSSLAGKGRSEEVAASAMAAPSGTSDMDPGFRQDDEQRFGVARTPRIIEIPVCYGGEHGPDLDAVAAHGRMSPDDVIARHTAGEYSVAMLGFAPGFPYLLGLDPALHVPRRAAPRTRVPAGSVAIGGAQTGVYPRELPGGWSLIGRTPSTLFDPQREPPTLLGPGDHVRFRAIDAGTFAHLAARKR